MVCANLLRNLNNYFLDCNAILYLKPETPEGCGLKLHFLTFSNQGRIKPFSN